MKVKGEDNVWSVDNELAEAAAMAEQERADRRRRKKKGTKVKSLGKRSTGDKVMVSGAMLMEVETVLQTQVLSAFLYSCTYCLIRVFYVQFVIPNANNKQIGNVNAKVTHTIHRNLRVRRKPTWMGAARTNFTMRKMLQLYMFSL